jgi:hypothetical protein
MAERKLSGKIVWPVSILLGMGVVVLIAVEVSGLGPWSRKAPKLLAELESLGVPVQEADFQKWLDQGTEGKTAMKEVYEATRDFRKVTSHSIPLGGIEFDPNMLPSKAQIVAMEVWKKEWEPVTRRLEEALGDRVVRLDIDPKTKLSYMDLLARLSGTRRSHETRSYFAAARGDRAAALHSVRQGARLVNCLKGDEGVTAFMAKCDWQSDYFRSVEAVVQFEPSLANEILPMIEEMAVPPASRAIVAETNFDLHEAHNADSLKLMKEWLNIPSEVETDYIETTREANGLPAAMINRALFASDVANMPEFVRSLDKDFRFKPGVDPKAALRKLATPAKESAFSRQFSWANGYFYEVGYDVERRALARKQTTILLLKALIFNQKNGRYPNNISELGPTSDPFDPASELNYAVENGEIRVWSVGEDGVNQMGKLVNSRRSYDETAKVFIARPTQVSKRKPTP